MKWGLVGASTIASRFMINALRADDPDAVKWLVTGSADRAVSYADDHNISNFTTDLDQLLAAPEVDAVYISSTNEKHYDQAMRAIGAGKHVLCEKPLAMTLHNAIDMVRAAKRAGVAFATNHHLRNAGSHLTIQELIKNGQIGDIISARIFHAVNLPENLRGWRINNKAAGGGVILDIIVHDADTVRFHLGEDPTDVIAIADATGLGEGVEDSVMTAWTMPSGVMVQVHASFTHKFSETGIEFYGTKGSIRGRGIMTQLPVGTIELIDDEGPKLIKFEDHDLYIRAVRLFEKSVSEGSSPAADGVDGIKSLAVALAVHEAAKSGSKVAVNYTGA